MPRIRTKSSSKSSSSALGPSGPPSPIKVVNLIHRPSSATTPSPCHPTSTVSKHGRASSGWLPLDGQKNDTASHTSEQCFLSTLPYELIITIVSLVDVRSRCRLARSSKHLKSTLYSEPSLWSRLDLSNRYSLGGDKRSTSRVSETMPVLFANSHSAARFRSLAKLDVSCTDMDLFLLTLPKIQPILAHSLTHLILNGCSNISSGSLYYLKHFPNLQALDLSHCEGIDDTALEVISFYLPNITHLNLSYLFRISERGISRLFRLPHLSSVNLMGCYRIKQYPWATASDGASRSILPIKELMLGEDSRIQTRGFWLLWCTFNFSTDRLVSLCPHLETLRLNMVLFDLPSDGLFTLLTHLHHLKHLSLVIDRVSVPALCTAASRLQQLDTFEATLHIGVSGDLVEQLVRANTFARLKALKFHSKHTTVFSDTSLAALVSSAPKLEYLELNGDDISPTGMTPVTQLKHLQSLLVHHTQCSNRTFKLLNQLKLRELTMTDWKQMEYSNRIWWIVKDRTGVWESLKKLELSGHALATEGSATPAGRHTRRGAGGVADKDLARLIERCQQLQWIDLSFPHTFPRTVAAITYSCPNLVYLRLARIAPPPLRLHGLSRNNPGIQLLSSQTSSPLLSPSVCDPSTSTFHASSPESKSLSQFARHGGRKLRVLDVTGNIGLSNWVLMQLVGLPCLHTLFVDACEGITTEGVVRFAETKEQELKRVHVRNCRGCRTTVQRREGVEVEVVVDGARVLGRRWGED